MAIAIKVLQVLHSRGGATVFIMLLRVQWGLALGGGLPIRC